MSASVSSSLHDSDIFFIVKIYAGRTSGLLRR